MKKLLFISALSLFLLTGCGDDDKTPSTPDTPQVSIPLTTVRRSGPNFANVVTSSWQYNGFRVQTIFDSNGNYRDYGYENGLIKQIESHLSNGNLLNTEVFFYDSQGRVTVSQLLGSSTGTRYEYTYEADGTVSIVTKTGNAQTQNDPAWTASMQFMGGELTHMDVLYNDGTTTESYDYTYDTKKKPTANVIGFTNIAITISNDPQRLGVLHNLSSVTHTTIDDDVVTSTRTFSYSVEDLPTMMTNTSTNPTDDYKLEYEYVLVDVPTN